MAEGTLVSETRPFTLAVHLWEVLFMATLNCEKPKKAQLLNNGVFHWFSWSFNIFRRMLSWSKLVKRYIFGESICLSSFNVSFINLTSV